MVKQMHMQKIYNQDHLLLNIYQELSPKEQSELKLQLLSDQDLEKENIEMMEIVNMLKSAELEPNDTSIEIIMEYAKSKSEELIH